MLVKCPKCNFDQPKDTYCAKCGIEMDSYKPIKPPLWKSFIKSPFFSLILFIGLSFGALMYLKNPLQMKLPSSDIKTEFITPVTQKLPSTTVESPNLTPPKPNEPPPPPNPPHLEQTEVNPKNSVPEQTANSHQISQPNQPLVKKDLSQAENAPPSETPPTLNSETLKGPLIVEIRFLEAPTQLVQKFMSEALENTGGDSGDMSYAIVKNSTAWLNHTSFKELDRISKNVPEVKKKLQWFSGALDTETKAPIGLDFQISIQERNGGHLSGDLFISRSLAEHLDGNLSTQRKEFTTHFETDVGSLIGLAGIMPHTELKMDDNILQDSLLKIFLSPTFQRNESDLLILLHFKPK